MMTDTNKTNESVMLELEDLIMSDAEQLESFSFPENVHSEDIPLSLLNYFQTSKNRAAVYEKAINEHHENFTASPQADVLRTLPELDMKRASSVAENEENQAGEPNDSSEELVESETDLAMRRCEKELEKLRCEEIQMEEEQGQKETNFQTKLGKITEAEKRHQMELDQEQKRAEEKLEQELLLQQQIISNLKRQVEDERRKIKEEQMRNELEEEEEEDTGNDVEATRRRREEKKRRQERKLKAMRLKEEQWKREEERKMELEKSRREEEFRREKEEKKIWEMQLRAEEARRKRVEAEKAMVVGEHKITGQKSTIYDEKRKVEGDGRKIWDLQGGKNKEQREMIVKTKKSEEMEKEKARTKSEGDKEFIVRRMMNEDVPELENENRKTGHKVQMRESENSQTSEKRKGTTNNMRKEENEQQLKMGAIENKQNRRVSEDEKNKKEGHNEGKKLQNKDSMREDEDRKRNLQEFKGRENKENREEKDMLESRKKNADFQNTVETRGSDGNRSQHPCAAPASLSERTQQKRLSWMKDCVSWSILVSENNKKQRKSTQREWRRVPGSCTLPPIAHHTLLHAAGCKSLQEITTVTLEDLPGFSLSPLIQCHQLQSLTLRCCGLIALEGISKLQYLSYIDVQENDIIFVDCVNMSSLQVLLLAHNKLKSIHGLSGAVNLSVLNLSHNSITRIAGLQSTTRLQKLSVAHNQLISTRGLKDVYTLIHLDCSHNHLANTEGLENSALLHTLDLKSNGLTEPPCLNNHVLLRELNLDDNNISSLQGLNDCWLPLLQKLSVAQNRITQLPLMANFVSIESLDLGYNCLTELQNVCENLEGCHFLQKLLLLGNPLQQEVGWRSILQKTVPGLKFIDSQQTNSFLSPPGALEVSVASDFFLLLCQAQLQQTKDLWQQHSNELRNSSTPLETLKNIGKHGTLVLKLAEHQRFAHEYGDTSIEQPLENLLNTDVDTGEKGDSHQEMDSPQTDLAVRKVDVFTSNEEGTSINLDETTESSFPDSELRRTVAAGVIQRRWRKYKQRCGNVERPSMTERGERKVDGEKPDPESLVTGRSSDRDSAATVIQAFWRGFALRRRLVCALAAAAAVTQPNTEEEEDIFEELDVEEFVFDEPILDQLWTLSDDSTISHELELEHQSTPRAPAPSLNPSPEPFANPKLAWMAGQSMISTCQASPPLLLVTGLSHRSEKILEEWGFSDKRTAVLMMKRAKKMKSTKKLPNRYRNSSEPLTKFRMSSYQPGPAGTRNRAALHNSPPLNVGETKPGFQQAERSQETWQQRAHQRLLAQADRTSESEHFLPEINSHTLNGGRVQLVADPAHIDPSHTAGQWATSRLTQQTDNAPRNSSGHPRTNIIRPTQATSAPSKRERISFRDNPVKLSGGWGGGKKRDKLNK